MSGEPEDIYDFYWEKGFSFSEEVITRYCLALRSKPFVILTGISGTGKTKIAQIFADYLTQGTDDEESRKIRESRIAFVPVRPDWMDNRGLLGFHNPITNKYQATQVLRLLLTANKEENRKHPYFVILDEMNLAKVEYYFSDFLSILESRTGDRPEGEALLLHDQGGKVTTDDNLPIPNQLEIPPNVFFTGTVNVDETTYMFSPKVLDRANVIEFNEVVYPRYDNERSGGDSFRLKEPDVRNFFRNEKLRPFCTKTDFDKYSSLLKQSENSDSLAELFQILESHHLHFGYRVINEVSRFVVLAEEKVEALDLNDAFDIQFLQKILPKLHGTKGKLQKPLNQVFAFCYDEQSDTEPEQQRLAKALNFDSNASYPRTAQKVARMLNDLEQQGYTSFIQ